jgi:hypothetical protein
MMRVWAAADIAVVGGNCEPTPELVAEIKSAGWKRKSDALPREDRLSPQDEEYNTKIDLTAQVACSIEQDGVD